MTDLQTKFTQAAQHLSDQDPILGSVIAGNGLPTFQPHTDYYGALVNSIIGQQLSVKAASTIKQRFIDLFGGKLPSPEAIINKSHEELRSVGLSNAKANYIRDLAEHVLDGRIKFDRIPDQTNAEIIAELTNVKGIGEWTVHMFLMFSVGRLDVLATGDLGVRNAVRGLYSLENTPTPQQVIDIAEQNHWHPYESVACWYLWRSLDNAPAA
jgi:DNA-3-methyladenine glycosylase II